MKITITIKGVPETKRNLDLISAIVKDMRSGLKTTGEYLIEVFSNQNFESEGQIIGYPWKPLNPAYALWKSTHYPGRGILERTRKMRHGFRGMSTKTYLAIRNTQPYAGRHQHGIGVPQRVIAAIGRNQRKDITKIIHDDVMSRLRRAL